MRERVLVVLEEEFAGGDADLAEAPGSVEKLVECVYFQRAFGMVFGDEALFPRAPDGFLAVRSSDGPKSRILATLPPEPHPRLLLFSFLATAQRRQNPRRRPHNGYECGVTPPTC